MCVTSAQEPWSIRSRVKTPQFFLSLNGTMDPKSPANLRRIDSVPQPHSLETFRACKYLLQIFVTLILV